jgi:hypothetical protein
MPATDNFGEQTPGLMTPASTFEAVTPSDTVDLAAVTRGLWVGTAGDVVAISKAGNTATFKNIANGTLLPIRVSRVKATSTTATDIVGLS